MRRRQWKRITVSGLSLVVLSSVSLGIYQAAAAPHTQSANEFDAPSGLAVGGGHLWVTNQAGNSVTEINPSNGAWITTFDRSMGYQFNQPTAITGAGGDLFVANASGSLVEMHAGSGALVRFISGSQFHIVHPVALASDGPLILVLNAGRSGASGSITEINSRTGHLVRTVSGARFAFADPTALTISGNDVFVADKANNSVTEVSTSGQLVRIVSGQGLDSPDGLAVADGRLWVANSASNSATEIAVATGAVMVTETDSGGSYGFGSPSVVVASSGNVFVVSPFGSSPMVTKLSATSGVPSWYMCNTNGPYYFSLLSAIAVSGNNLWVASRSGANSKTPAAATGSLTEFSSGDGSLITTLPSPSSSTTTSTSTTTTTVP